MVHKALGAEYSASAVIETYFCLPNVPDGTDLNLGFKTFLGGGGGVGKPPEPPRFPLFYSWPVPTPGGYKLWSGNLRARALLPIKRNPFLFCLLLFEATMLIQNISVVKYFRGGGGGGGSVKRNLSAH